uniref:Uncharacterized protein n=1 Tax=Gadus morhua TaxID=8049 RepID=A0A8C5B032_GADMO
TGKHTKTRQTMTVPPPLRGVPPLDGLEGGPPPAGAEGGRPLDGLEGGPPPAGAEGGPPLDGLEGGPPPAGAEGGPPQPPAPFCWECSPRNPLLSL